MQQLLGRALARRLVHGQQWRRVATPSLFKAFSTSNEQPVKQLTNEEAKSKAQAILAMFPGDTNAKKATFATLTGGMMAFLVANNIYIPNDETLILAAFIIVVRTLYVKLSGPIADMIDAAINEVRTKMMSSRQLEMKGLEEEIADLEQFRDFPAVTKDLLKTRQENIILEAEYAELVERTKFLTQIKMQLDDAVRKYTEKKALERRQKIDAIMAGVLTELKDPKLQNAILQQCLEDLKQLPVQKAQLNK